MNKTVAAGIVLAMSVFAASTSAMTSFTRGVGFDGEPRSDADALVGDLDADGVTDDVDNCPATPNAGQQDRDRDGVGDLCDNCVMKSNADQADSDQDGAGDACERKHGHQTTEPL
jgi:hypothetical protein